MKEAIRNIMKNNSYKNKYRRLKKVIWAGASTGVVTGLILMGTTNAALADTVDSSQPAYSQETRVPAMHMMRRWNSLSRASSLAVSLGLDPQAVTEELKSGKPLKQVLQENGVDSSQLQKAFAGRKSQNKRLWKKNLN